MSTAQNYTIRLPKPDETEAIAAMHFQAWLDTYPDEKSGVSRAWVEERATDRIMSPEGLKRRRGYLERSLAEPEHWFYRVAVADDDTILGHLIAEKTTEKQEVSSIYLIKRMHGTGLAQAMFDELMQWFDADRPILLEVVDYNQRAIRFYEKLGFKKIDGSEYKFADVMPSFWMKREATQ